MNNEELSETFEEDNLKPALMVEGFHRLDNDLVKDKAPKITWGKRYLAMPDADKLVYLEKLASTMNHAAYLIQNERNNLLEICAKQEGQLHVLAENLGKNNTMIQEQITLMNADRQSYNLSIATLNARIRKLEDGSRD